MLIKLASSQPGLVRGAVVLLENSITVRITEQHKRMECNAEQLFRMRPKVTGKSKARDIWRISVVRDLVNICTEREKYWISLFPKDGSKKRKTMREANDVVFDRAFCLWFSQRRIKGDPISGPLLCEKALELNEKLGGLADFKDQNEGVQWYSEK
ncbi:jerky-like protein [Trichonephila clavipes]|nr:jerky-like protein [Trichonephila clavipes]